MRTISIVDSSDDAIKFQFPTFFYFDGHNPQRKAFSFTSCFVVRKLKRLLCRSHTRVHLMPRVILMSYS